MRCGGQAWSWIAAVDALEAQNRVSPSHDAARFEKLTHHVVLLKECVVEVVAEGVTVHRREGATFDALSAIVRG